MDTYRYCCLELWIGPYSPLQHPWTVSLIAYFETDRRESCGKYIKHGWSDAQIICERKGKLNHCTYVWLNHRRTTEETDRYEIWSNQIFGYCELIISSKTRANPRQSHGIFIHFRHNRSAKRCHLHSFDGHYPNYGNGRALLIEWQGCSLELFTHCSRFWKVHDLVLYI